MSLLLGASVSLIAFNAGLRLDLRLSSEPQVPIGVSRLTSQAGGSLLLVADLQGLYHGSLFSLTLF